VSTYPKKCWYVAAICEEIREQPVGRRLLDTDVALWRTTTGQLFAFENRCAHRAFPLSHGSVDGDRLICGYHGCVYDAFGKCIDVPSQAHVPTGMAVPVFPVFENWPFVWIWLGPRRPGAGDRPPTVPWVADPGWETFTNSWQVNANYMMLHEHYLDFSYAPIVHAGDIPEEIRIMPAFSDVEVSETAVSYTRVLPEAGLTGWEADASGLDRTQVYKRTESGTFASPALHLQRWDIEGPEGEVFSTTRIHAITPETDSSTHVFMAGSRNYALGRQPVTDRLRVFLDGVAQRDASILEMASNHSGYGMWQAGVEFQADAAVTRARRIVGAMLAKEAGRSPASRRSVAGMATN
jgi:phenylpropionate dioxygenase-like ring-hydroxylating dioxygenase large terminal subunit